MPETIGTAYIQIEPTMQGISGSLSNILDSEATKAGSSAGGKLSSALKGALGVGAGAVAGLTTAIAGAGAALTNAATGVAQYGDGIDKMSQKLGISSSFYQEWDAVLQHSGTSMDSMSATFKKLATSSQDATDGQKAAYEQLGLSMDQVKSMSTEDLFTSVITGLQGMEEGTERTALATTLLGKGAMEMGALLNTSSEDTQAMINTVNQLGGVIDEKGVKASAAFQDSLQDMQTAFSGIKNNAMSELLPSFTQVMTGLTGLATGTKGAENDIKQGMEGLSKSISEKIPTIIDSFSSIADSLVSVAPELISTLGTSILNAIPKLLPTLKELVSSIGNMIISNLNLIVKTGLQVILELADSISSSLPSLIPTIVDVVLEITDTLIDNVDLLIDGAIALIVGLAEGLINALPRLIEKAPEIVMKLCEALIRNAPKLVSSAIELILTLQKGLLDSIPKLIEAAPKLISSLKEELIKGLGVMVEIGSDLVDGIKRGISQAWERLTSWLGDLCSGLVDKVKSALRIGSPSKVFRDEVGQWIPEGIAVGIDANADSVTDSIDALTSDAVISANNLSKDVTFNADYSGAETNNDSNMLEDFIVQIGQTIESALNNVGVYMDGQTVGTLVAASVNNELGRMSVRRV